MTPGGFTRCGLQSDGERERTEVLRIRDLPDGRHAPLIIVNTRRPGTGMTWVYWDASRMSLASHRVCAGDGGAGTARG